MTLERVFAYIDDNLERALAEVVEYCKLPTVSAHATAIDETAQHTLRLLAAEVFDARALPKHEPGFPGVYAEHAGRSPKTMLFYNHYDVQPPDPQE